MSFLDSPPSKMVELTFQPSFYLKNHPQITQKNEKIVKQMKSYI